MTSPNENYTSWRTGMKVVCVDAEWTTKLNRKELEEGVVYTIRWIGVCPVDGIVCVQLEEVTRRCQTGEDREYWGRYGEMPFRISRFRPVQTRPTSIAIFQSILSNPHKKIHKVEGERV